VNAKQKTDKFETNWRTEDGNTLAKKSMNKKFVKSLIKTFLKFKVTTGQISIVYLSQSKIVFPTRRMSNY